MNHGMDEQTQWEMEMMFDKHQLIPRLQAEYNHPEVIAVCEQKEIPLLFAIDMLVHIMILKRADVGTMVGILHKHFPTKQECADMLLKAAEADLINWATDIEKFIVAIEVAPNIMADLDKFQFPLPMVIPPKHITNNRQTGYLTPAASKGSLILKNNHHDGDICLDHLNRMNQVPLSLNAHIAHFVNNKWKGLDKRKEDEEPEKFLERKRAFQKYTETSKDVVDSLIMLGNRIHLTHKYDKRGRTYAVGYHVNTQGNAWNKAVIEFHDQEIISEEVQ